MIAIVPHRPAWRAEFEALALELRAALGGAALRVDHIGSTAVPGLCAKDIIDIQVTVAQLDEAHAVPLAACGYRRYPTVQADHVPPLYPGPAADWAKQFYLQAPGRRRVNLHLRAAGRPNQRYALLFRDYLVAHAAMASAYGELKQRLAAALARDDDYPDVKDPAVDLIWLAAEDWARQTGWVPVAPHV